MTRRHLVVHQGIAAAREAGIDVPFEVRGVLEQWADGDMPDDALADRLLDAADRSGSLREDFQAFRRVRAVRSR